MDAETHGMPACAVALLAEVVEAWTPIGRGCRIQGVKVLALTFSQVLFIFFAIQGVYPG